MFGLSDKNIYVDQPLIQGKENGIESKGTMNFYDGTIIATTNSENKPSAINGKVAETPPAYSATMEDVSDETEKKQIATLAVMSNVEARIGRATYAKIEDAIDAVR